MIPAKNKLPFIDYLFYDRMLQILSAEDIVALFSSLLFESKNILLVCQDKYDALPMSTSLMSLIYPFEWSMPVIPLIKDNPEDENSQEMENINSPQVLIIGVHESQFEEMQGIIDPANRQATVIVDLRELYDQELGQSYLYDPKDASKLGVPRLKNRGNQP